MTEQHYRVTPADKPAVIVTELKLIALCIHKCSTGKEYTPAQVWEAMQIVNNVRAGVPYKSETGLTVEVIPYGGVNK